MLVVVPSFICCGRGRYQKTTYIGEAHDISGYYWKPFIWEVDHIYSDVGECFLKCVGGEGNRGFEEGLYTGGKDVVHSILAYLESFGYFTLKMNLADSHLHWLLPFNLFLISYINSQNYALCSFFSCEEDYLSWIWVIPVDDVFIIFSSSTLFCFTLSIFFFFVIEEVWWSFLSKCRMMRLIEQDI